MRTPPSSLEDYGRYAVYRGNKDEVFVRAGAGPGRLCVRATDRQSTVLHRALESELDPRAKAAFVTAVAIYVETARIDKKEVQNALSFRTVRGAQALIDRLYPLTFGGRYG